MSALCQKQTSTLSRIRSDVLIRRQSLLALRKQTDHASASREEGKRVRRLTRGIERDLFPGGLRNLVIQK